MKIPKVPKGWKIVRGGLVIKTGDKIINGARDGWNPCQATVGLEAGQWPETPIIRRIKPRKKH